MCEPVQEAVETTGAELSITAVSEGEIPAVQELWAEYWDSFGFAPDFQGFAEECRSLPGEYAPPSGRLLLAMVKGEPAGTAAFRGLSERACEGKRFYVRPRYRRAGVGKALLARLVQEAAAQGYEDMYGHTMKSMKAAVSLYEQFGFSEVPPYEPRPTANSIFLRLRLRPESM